MSPKTSSPSRAESESGSLSLRSNKWAFSREKPLFTPFLLTNFFSESGKIPKKGFFYVLPSQKLGSLRIESEKTSLEPLWVSENRSSLSSLESEPRLVTSLIWSISTVFLHIASYSTQLLTDLLNCSTVAVHSSPLVANLLEVITRAGSITAPSSGKSRYNSWTRDETQQNGLFA